MSKRVEQKLSSGTLAKSVISFIVNYIFLWGIFLVMLLLYHPQDYAQYLTDKLGIVFFVAGCMFLMYWVVYQYYLFTDKSFLIDTKNIWLFFTIFNFCVIVFILSGKLLNIYARPMALFAFLILFLMGKRDAVFLNLIFAITMYLFDVLADYNAFVVEGMTGGMFPAFFLCFIGGTFAAFMGSNNKTRAAVLGTGLVTVATAVGMQVLLGLASYTKIYSVDFLIQLGYGAGGAFTSAILTLALLPVFEGMFNVLTSFRLRELTSPEAKLLRRLKAEALGTFNHSRSVAQLVESCAEALGENVELARAAAYYHDVGKLRQPDFFTENQTDHNLHDELTPELSSDIIRSHTKDGYDIITAYRLPKFFADVSIEHHGTMPIKYFYTKALRMSDGEINVETYSYQGPKPQSRIAALVMIADACEAATRSLTDRSVENVEKAVRGIIQERMDLEQFTDCELTMADLNLIKQTLVGALTGLYHHRIKYPDLRFTTSGVEDNGGTQRE